MTVLDDFLVPLAAAVASVFAVLGTVEQLTAATRLRRLAASVREESSLSPAHDQQVLRSLHREILSRIIALQSVPARSLLGAAALALVGLGWAFLVGYSVGVTVQLHPTWGEIYDIVGFEGVILAALAPAFVCSGLLGWMEVVLERRRISKAYLDGKHPLYRRYYRSWKLAVGSKGILPAAVLGTGLTSAALWVGFTAGYPTMTAAVVDTLLIPAALGVIIGGVLTSLYLHRHSSWEPWMHPRLPEARGAGAPPPEAAAPEPENPGP
ncbi:hypothetical protein ACH9EU_16235 [Kocuria sp. M1R5S2]|uniref:hypothetical protein n=1 Tax=Kocuria rhizosphaerae TaxID=3376285 RepID=UPI0037874CDA